MNGKIMLNGKAYSSSGRPSREVTMSEWLALPDTKYTDGIVYYIKDVGGANQFPPLIYSDEEREVGVWRDGKPLYQKSKYIASFPSNSWDTIPMNISNFDKCVDYRCIIRLSNGTYEDVNYSRADGANATFYATILSNGDFWFRSYQSLTADGWVTIWYTKTTDTPGSGTWTTDGTYAKHYSTDEKVIGTWIDGKTLYEKTITFTPNSSHYTVDISSLNIDDCIYLNGWFINIGGNYIYLNHYAGNSDWHGLIYSPSNGGCLIADQDNSSRFGLNCPWTATIRYTKNTD